MFGQQALLGKARVAIGAPLYMLNEEEGVTYGVKDVLLLHMLNTFQTFISGLTQQAS